MPEGDTVLRAARSMHKALAGRTITVCDFRVPQLATSDLSGQTVIEVVPRGKHMLTRTDAGLTLHTHFLMDGTWRIFHSGQRWSGGPAHEIRAVIGNERWVAVGYRMPVIDLLPTDEEHRVVGHLGPDILGPDWDPREAVRRIAAAPNVQIGEALLDQRNLAGIGNLYKNEALFLRGVDPRRMVAEVDVAGVLKMAHKLMTANIAHWEQSTTGDKRPHHKHWVFERQGQPCRRCGTTIEMSAEGSDPATQRLTYRCPNCQR